MNENFSANTFNDHIISVKNNESAIKREEIYGKKKEEFLQPENFIGNIFLFRAAQPKRRAFSFTRDEFSFSRFHKISCFFFFFPDLPGPPPSFIIKKVLPAKTTSR